MKGYVKTKQPAGWLSGDDIGLTVKVKGAERFTLAGISARADVVNLFGPWNYIYARHVLAVDDAVTIWMPRLSKKGA